MRQERRTERDREGLCSWRNPAQGLHSWGSGHGPEKRERCKARELCHKSTRQPVPCYRHGAKCGPSACHRLHRFAVASLGQAQPPSPRSVANSRPGSLVLRAGELRIGSASSAL